MRGEATLVELQSFVDLTRSHGRAVTAIQWLPQRKARPLWLCGSDLFLHEHWARLLCNDD